MKTQTRNQKSKAQNRPEQVNTAKPAPIDFEKRRANRSLDTENVLALLRAETPGFFQIAEVVGKWVWIQFSEIPAAEIRQQLAQLGFHWNNTRRTWQHPCGMYRDARATSDPRRKYGSYFATDRKAA